MSKEDGDAKTGKTKEFKDLRRSRGGHRAFVNQVMKSSEAILLDLSDGEEVIAANRTELINNATILEDKLNELRKIDQKILDLVDH